MKSITRIAVVGLGLSMAVMTMLFGTQTTANAAESGADQTVQLSSMYSYDEMEGDILDLIEEYPEIISAENTAQTALGRDITVVVLGNRSAAHNIMVQSSIHAREYLCTQMTMGMIEYYASRYDTDPEVQKMLDNTCFYIVPMSNPDGVSIAQYGSASAAASKATQSFIKATGHNTSWKSNAMGVDLNRNFDIGWAAINQGVYSPSYEKYKGTSANSEAETKMLVALASARPYDAFISYHMKGGIIYYDEPGNTAENSAASKLLAQTISSSNGYKLHNLKADITTSGSVVQGGFNDWVQIALNKPGVTVEVGNSLPPQAQKIMKSIFNQNKGSWLKVAKLYEK